MLFGQTEVGHSLEIIKCFKNITKRDADIITLFLYSHQ